jgi:glycosyltransferase involved in cell wall biosynthesis
VDEYSAYPGTSPDKAARLRAAEQPVLEAADLVIVTSRALLEAKRPGNPRTYLVPNAVNAAGYQQHLAQGAPVPPELASIGRPRLGYLGLIGPKLDFALLEAVARARPDWSLVFVGTLAGRAPAGWERLRALPNVQHVAGVPAERVPAYVCGFDVGLMPYAPTAHAQAIDPLKLYDYLAGGKPIVSADLPALEGFRHVVRVASTPDTVVAAVETALRERAPELVAERRRLAAANSWEHRVEALSTLIEMELSGASGMAGYDRSRRRVAARSGGGDLAIPAEQ